MAYNVGTDPAGTYFVAVGDSITKGSHDDIFSDGTGFEPILETLLTNWSGFAHIVVNEGISGDTSAVGAAYINALVAQHPGADHFLILYGSNDAMGSVPSGKNLLSGEPGYAGSYKDNMKQIISAVLASGKIPLLAKVPYNDQQCPSCNQFIRDYNIAIDELVADYGIPVIPPDFYTYYQNNLSELADGLHPNGIGYQSMSDLWFTAITQ